MLGSVCGPRFSKLSGAMPTDSLRDDCIVSLLPSDLYHRISDRDHLTEKECLGGSRSPRISVHHGGDGMEEFLGWERVAEAPCMWEG